MSPRQDEPTEDQAQTYHMEPLKAAEWKPWEEAEKMDTVLPEEQFSWPGFSSEAIEANRKCRTILQVLT